MPKRKCSSIDESLGYNLLRLRKNRGYTQQQIADRLNLNRSTYTKYETGVSEPSIEIMRKIAEIFSVDISVLVADKADAEFRDKESEKMDVNSTERSIINLYRKLDDLYKRRFISFLGKLKRDQDNNMNK